MPVLRFRTRFNRDTIGRPITPAQPAGKGVPAGLRSTHAFRRPRTGLQTVSSATLVKEIRVDSIWLWPLGLVAFLLAWPALRALGVRHLGGKLRTQALSPQPDHIFLVRVAEPRWRNAQSRESADRQLASSGFVEAGVYLVREMPELTLGLYANPGQSAYAILYDHPRSGFWAEFVTRYQDGSLVTYSTLEPMDVEVPEGSVHVAAPQLSLTDLWKKLLHERPKQSMLPCDRGHAAQDFERGYAESVAYHKQHTPMVREDYDEELKQAA